MLLDDEFVLFGQGGATFVDFADSLEHKFARKKLKPEAVFVFLGSNDLDSIDSTAEVSQVINACEQFHERLRDLFPEAKLIYAQVEDRYCYGHDESAESIKQDFKAKSNK